MFLIVKLANRKDGYTCSHFQICSSFNNTPSTGCKIGLKLTRFKTDEALGPKKDSVNRSRRRWFSSCCE